MANITLDKQNRKIELECDCGVIHIISLQNKDLKVKSYLPNSKKEYKDEKEKKKSESDDIFGSLFESESNEFESE